MARRFWKQSSRQRELMQMTMNRSRKRFKIDVRAVLHGLAIALAATFAVCIVYVVSLYLLWGHSIRRVLHYALPGPEGLGKAWGYEALMLAGFATMFSWDEKYRFSRRYHISLAVGLLYGICYSTVVALLVTAVLKLGLSEGNPVVTVLLASIYLIGPFVTTSFAFRLTKQPRPGSGKCHVCGYDLRGGHERCPECGTVVRRAPNGIP